jgi:hypothetical protein
VRVPLILSWPGRIEPGRSDALCRVRQRHGPASQPAAYATVLRDERHKLVAAHGLETGEIYGLEVDPEERRNLWADVDHQAVKLRLLQRLCDPAPTPAPSRGAGPASCWRGRSTPS